MTNDKKILKTVEALKMMCDSWLGIVKSLNQDALTDSILRQIIQKSQELKVLDETNKPE